MAAECVRRSHFQPVSVLSLVLALSPYELEASTPIRPDIESKLLCCRFFHGPRDSAIWATGVDSVLVRQSCLVEAAH